LVGVINLHSSETSE